MARLKDLHDPKYVIDFVDICAKLDPSKTNKYVPFMLKLLEEYIADVRKDYETKMLVELKNLIDTFHDLAERNQIENKDIYSYKSFEELEKVVLDAKRKLTESQIKKNETKVLFEDDNYLVVRPLSLASSRLYGASTKWCTASNRDDGKQYFLNHGGKGVLVYFINKKSDPREDKYAKLAFHNETNFKDEHQITLWDSKSNKLSSNEVFDIIGKVIPLNIYEIIQNELYKGGKIKVIE